MKPELQGMSTTTIATRGKGEGIYQGDNLAFISSKQNQVTKPKKKKSMNCKFSYLVM